jgi:hypothetical protein
MSNPHTPLPWRVIYDNDTGPGDDGFFEWYELENASGEPIARIDSEANAALIVRAVNSHAVLVEALQKIFTLTLANHCDRDEALEEIRSNIRAALAQLDKP